MVTKGIFVRLTAKAGKEADVRTFLEGGLELVEAEPGTTAWFALEFEPGVFGIFDVFPGTNEREDHLSGRVAAALVARAPELFAEAPKLELLDVVAAKLPEAVSARK
jgi:quinol monooxygenase YgiN